MEPSALAVILKRFESPDEVRAMAKGKFEIVRLGGVTIGRATYQPGWRWSEHVGPQLGQTHCHVEHVGLVLSGRAAAASADGSSAELRAGNLFYIPPIPHDSWVIGDEPLCLATLSRCGPLRELTSCYCPPPALLRAAITATARDTGS